MKCGDGTMLIDTNTTSLFAISTLRVGLLLTSVAVGELVFDLSGARAANPWKIENSKSKMKKNRRVATRF
jgi:hypothetical protein